MRKATGSKPRAANGALKIRYSDRPRSPRRFAIHAVRLPLIHPVQIQARIWPGPPPVDSDMLAGASVVRIGGLSAFSRFTRLPPVPAGSFDMPTDPLGLPFSLLPGLQSVAPVDKVASEQRSIADDNSDVELIVRVQRRPSPAQP
ncbi:hypothetical protein DACRYDRAFT_107012 [Dacryopinax primogenitus]|uniref:Uncharacterized protein n=1 Tax=Dacryopinax primogenitus (strain DJM 731) TaxID=1858805 RepID=M5G2L4_DACPD|nr:uncharacterized protein DACRYDRAFT_107012 [Dacryopinax primogenitus]EJU02929.1 hypothetical protein DACRYDRAFT_107012 [Dacryopinax primogenitus]